MKVHPEQAYPNYKHSCMTWRDYVQLPLYVDEIDAIINTQVMKNPNDILFHLVALYNGINLDIGTLKKEKGDIFSEFCTESFKSKFLKYVNELLFEMVTNSPKGYIFRRNNSHSTEKWGRYMPENILWQRESGYD